MAWACLGDGDASLVVDHVSQNNRQDFSEKNLEYVTRSVNLQRHRDFARTGQLPAVTAVAAAAADEDQDEDQDEQEGDDVVTATPAAGRQLGEPRSSSGLGAAPTTAGSTPGFFESNKKQRVA